MRAQLSAELLKQRSTRTAIGLFATMFGLVLFAIILHGFGVAPENVRSASDQLTIVLGRGEALGALFAALLGAMSFTGEIRHGTIRPTFLATPWRGRVVGAKIYASTLIGIGFGLAACALAAAVGSAALAARGVEVQLDAGDYAQFLAGGAAAAALWAAIGVGLGAVIRHQVATVVALCAWLLFVEGILVGDVAGVAEVGRFAPGAAAAAITRQDPGTLLAPAVGFVLLAAYAAVAALLGSLVTDSRDVV